MNARRYLYQFRKDRVDNNGVKTGFSSGFSKDDFLYYKNLEELVIVKTDLTYIELDAFDNLHHLRSVTLQSNEI